jgi:ferredoxin-NADP reductase
LRIEALSPGWRASFEALLRSSTNGNAGLVPQAAAHPAAPGFRRLAVAAIDRESEDVISITMQSPDGKPLEAARPGQYVVLRLQPATGGPPLSRSYSLSGPGSAERYRISVKIEPKGTAGVYLRDRVRVGNALVCYSRPGSADRLGEDFDAAGHLSQPLFEKAGVPQEAEVYLCGPNRFMADMKMELAHFGIAPERIHAEVFQGSEPMTPGVVGRATRIPHLPKDDGNAGLLVSFARSGIAAHWKASAYQNILELAEACDIPVRWSCRTGVCHSCESGLVSGAVDYEPEPLDKPADGNVLVCCSRPNSDVVIDS